MRFIYIPCILCLIRNWLITVRVISGLNSTRFLPSQYHFWSEGGLGTRLDYVHCTCSSYCFQIAVNYVTCICTSFHILFSPTPSPQVIVGEPLKHLMPWRKPCRMLALYTERDGGTWGLLSRNSTDFSAILLGCLDPRWHVAFHPCQVWLQVTLCHVLTSHASILLVASLAPRQCDIIQCSSTSLYTNYM